MKNQKILIMIAASALISAPAMAFTDYATNNGDAQGEYKSTHDDISTVGVKEKEPSLDQAEKIREKNLEKKVEPKKVVPKPDLNLNNPEDRALMGDIENGTGLK